MIISDVVVHCSQLNVTQVFIIIISGVVVHFSQLHRGWCGYLVLRVAQSIWSEPKRTEKDKELRSRIWLADGHGAANWTYH